MTQLICGLVKNVDFAHINTPEYMLNYSKGKLKLLSTCMDIREKTLQI